MDKAKIISIDIVNIILKNNVWNIQELPDLQNITDKLKVFNKSNGIKNYIVIVYFSELIAYDDNRRPNSLFFKRKQQHSQYLPKRNEK